MSQNKISNVEASVGAARSSLKPRRNLAGVSLRRGAGLCYARPAARRSPTNEEAPGEVASLSRGAPSLRGRSTLNEP